MAEEQKFSFDSAEDLFSYAIKREIFAHEFYTKAVDRIKNLATREMLKELAAEELKHKQMIESVVAEKRFEGLAKRPKRRDLGIAEYLVYKDVSDAASTQDVLIAAIKFEEGSERFYAALHGLFEGHELAEFLEWLMIEEQGHKIRLEREYDERILTDN